MMSFIRVAALFALVLCATTAEAANRFWVGGLGTWDASNTTNWSTSTGGAGGASVPGGADVAIFDANSGTGTVTLSSPPTINSLTFTNFAGTWTNAVNNSNLTIQAGITITQASGAATINFGSATYTFNAQNGNLNIATVTSVTISAASATFSFTATQAASDRFINVNGQTLGTVTVAAVTNKTSSAGVFIFGTLANGTIGTLNLNGPIATRFQGGGTLNITNPLNWNASGSATAAMTMRSDNTSQSNISVASGTSTLNWAVMQSINFTGGGTFNATNSIDIGNNTGATITPPSSGGGGGRIIGG